MKTPIAIQLLTESLIDEKVFIEKWNKEPKPENELLLSITNRVIETHQKKVIRIEREIKLLKSIKV